MHVVGGGVAEGEGSRNGGAGWRELWVRNHSRMVNEDTSHTETVWS